LCYFPRDLQHANAKLVNNIKMISEELKKDIEDFNDFRQETIEKTYD